VSNRTDYGTVGDYRILGGRTTLGVMIRRFELYGGYQGKWLTVQDRQRNTAGSRGLHGPVMGLRVWF
jgi:hypothetical protein